MKTHPEEEPVKISINCVIFNLSSITFLYRRYFNVNLLTNKNIIFYCYIQVRLERVNSDFLFFFSYIKQITNYIIL